MKERAMEDQHGVIAKVDRLIVLVTRLETKVEAVLKTDAECRLTKLETKNRVLTWVGGAALTVVGMVLAYFK